MHARASWYGTFAWQAIRAAAVQQAITSRAEAEAALPPQLVRLLSRPGEQSYGVAAALAVVLVALTLAMVLLVDRLGMARTRRPA